MSLKDTLARQHRRVARIIGRARCKRRQHGDQPCPLGTRLVTLVKATDVVTESETARPGRRRGPEAADEGGAGTTSTALVPQRERTVDFYGAAIPVAQIEDGTLYVALRPITDYLGVYFSAQRRRVLRDEVMTERLRTVLMTALDGRQRAQLCLPLDLLPGYLFGITPSQARPEIIEKLKRYRADCFRVLWHAFAGEASEVVSAPAGVLVPSPESRVLEHIEQMALAIARMAREQRAFEQHNSTLLQIVGQQCGPKRAQGKEKGHGSGQTTTQARRS